MLSFLEKMFSNKTDNKYVWENVCQDGVIKYNSSLYKLFYTIKYNCVETKHWLQQMIAELNANNSYNNIEEIVYPLRG